MASNEFLASGTCDLKSANEGEGEWVVVPIQLGLPSNPNVQGLGRPELEIKAWVQLDWLGPTWSTASKELVM